MIEQTVAMVVGGKEIQELVSVAPAAKVSEAVALMSSRGIGAVVIRGAGGSVDGIFTERDLVKRVVHEGRDPKATPMSAVMSGSVRRVATSATVEEALRLMVVHGHRHLLVEDAGKVLGLISIRDLMRWMVLPDQPIASEGRVGVIRARAEQATQSIKGMKGGDGTSR